MSDLVSIEYQDKNGDVYESRSRLVVPRAGDFVQLSAAIYPVVEVIWVDEEGLRVVVVIGNKTKRVPFKSRPDNYGNW
jgi:hypothetical protein